MNLSVTIYLYKSNAMQCKIRRAAYEIFSLDLGNKQTKLKVANLEYVLPSRYLNQADMPMSVGSSTTNNDLTSIQSHSVMISMFEAEMMAYTLMST